MVCIYIYKSISKSKNIFVRYESQHFTRQTLNQDFHVPHTYSTQSMHPITYSRLRIFNISPVNSRRWERFGARVSLHTDVLYHLKH